MHQSGPTFQQHEPQQPVLRTYAESSTAGPSSQPPSTPIYENCLTQSVTVQAPLGKPSICTRMPFPSTLNPSLPTPSPYSSVHPTSDDVLDIEHLPDSSDVVHVSPNKSTQRKPRKCGKLINNNR